MTRLVTIVGVENYAVRAKKLLSESERQDIAVMIAESPDCGAPMIGTGGCRKVRFALAGRGKSGSVRVVYVFCGDKIPIFLLAL